MSYSAEISRDNPTAILFVIDQSGSMDEKMTTGRSKADFLADVLNRTIYTLIINCTKADGVRDYFDVGVIAYGQSGGPKPGLGGSLSGGTFHPISALERSPLRVEDRSRLEDDGAGGVLERKIKFPVWFETVAGGGTPMCAALTNAAEALVEWCDKRPNSYPPTVLHVTDGASTDGNPENVAAAIKKISTVDGPCLLFNVHISTIAGQGIQFPPSDSALPDNYARQLYSMSSDLPPHVARMAADKGYQIGEVAKGFMFNADPKDIVNFFEIGTRPRIVADR
jgi:hypothetical protein